MMQSQHYPIAGFKNEHVIRLRFDAMRWLVCGSSARQSTSDSLYLTNPQPVSHDTGRDAELCSITQVATISRHWECALACHGLRLSPCVRNDCSITEGKRFRRPYMNGLDMSGVNVVCQSRRGGVGQSEARGHDDRKDPWCVGGVASSLRVVLTTAFGVPTLEGPTTNFTLLWLAALFKTRCVHQ
jgi:hypothetical protein